MRRIAGKVIGGILLSMMLFGTLGCGDARRPVSGHMVDGPGMVYTPEDQSPFAGTWRSRDGSIVMTVDSGGQFKESHMCLTVDGEAEFTADLWVYSTGSVKLTQEKKGVMISGTFRDLSFSHKENAFRGYLSDGGTIWLTKDGTPCGEEDVTLSDAAKEPSKHWVCPACRTENEGNFCTECGSPRPAPCGNCGWQPASESIPAYCPECGKRLK